MHEFTATVKSSFQLYGMYNAWYTESTHFLAAQIQHTMSENLSVCQQKHRSIQRESRIFVCSAARMIDWKKLEGRYKYRQVKKGD